MPYHFLKLFFINTPTSAEVARTYADNVNKPLGSLLTPLRLAYYAYLLALATRLGLNYLFDRAYNKFDLPMYHFGSIFRHQMAGLMLTPCLLLAYVFDFIFVVRPHQKVAPMLLDLLQSDGPTSLFKKLSSSRSNHVGQSFFTAGYTLVLLDRTKDLFDLLQENLSYLLADFGIHLPGFSHPRRHNHRNHQLRLVSPPPLAHFRSFSATTRHRLALLDRFIEFLIVISRPFESVFLLASAVYFCWRAIHLDSSQQFRLQRANKNEIASLERLSPPSATLVHSLPQLQLYIELVATTLVIQYLHKQCLLFFKLVLLFSFAWCLHAREVLQLAVKQMKAAERSSHFGLVSRCPYTATHQRLSAAIHSIWVSFFIREHCALLVNLVHLNEHFLSQLIFAFYTPILTFSVFVLCLLYFQPGNFIVKLYLLLLYISILLIFGFLIALSAVVGVLYDKRAGSQLFRAQMLCRGSSWDAADKRGTAFLRTKLKLMSYYEVLKTDEKVTFTFGSHAKVENTWLWELFLLYSSLIMYSFKIFIKRSTQLRYLNAGLNDF